MTVGKEFKKSLDWEEKAKRNPLFAVMSVPDFEEKTSEFTDGDLERFFEKGELIFRRHFEPLLSQTGMLGSGMLAVEYGCGMGRLLRQFLAAGMRCAGIDISPTMIEHAHRLVPEAEALHVLDSANRVPLADASADFVYSYAVLQHINRLSSYTAALDEMCRLLKPGGWMRIQINADDSPFRRFDPTQNLEIETGENYVIKRFPEVDGKEPEKREFNHWSGVDVSFPIIQRLLNERGVELMGYEHYPPKPRACWLTARKPGYEA